ncbi:hypothetical protein BDY19DRAFT_140654 [Irpex rosettiformis]|uniref:Uncharacterized protein n=1 Tax=Irpex rosettiformis TaxID=378272 RepID=A0ACB8U4X9_9APHY|nr:hypothetical protein BDY19DRAFT_140654 [Irpex rosettiformis]
MGTIYLPNEIIDLIASKFSSTLEVHDLLACSLISRQWRDVVAPHLFRYILISPYSISRRIILGFGFSGFVGIARSLETTLVVTEHLQTLHIQNFMLSLPSLHSLLSHLSSLQNLIVEEINLCDTDSTGLEGPISRLAIPNISIASINEDYPRYHQLAQFLALFSDIGQLSVIDYISASSSWEATRSTVMDAVAGSRVGELQVRTLNLGYGECARLFVMGFLYQIDALRHLTSLGLTIRHVHERDRLNELLCASGRTLEYLDVKVQLDHRWFPLEDVIPSTHIPVPYVSPSFLTHMSL